MHDKTAESALSLNCIRVRVRIFVVLQLQLTWPQLSCMHSIGKFPVRFFRHELSDLFALALSTAGTGLHDSILNTFLTVF